MRRAVRASIASRLAARFAGTRSGPSAAHRSEASRLTIPRIVIAPVNDNLPERIETVILRLTPPPFDPPAYELGRPIRAGAVILDNDYPLLAGESLSSAGVHLRLSALDGTPFRLESSPDLANWEAEASGIVVEGGVSFVEDEIHGQQVRFFRVIAEYGELDDD